MSTLKVKGVEAARIAYEAHKAPAHYYEEKWDRAHKQWVYLAVPGLFYCWLADGMPTTQQKSTQ